MKKTFVIGCIALATACTGAEKKEDAARETRVAPSALIAAHEAYLGGDFVAMGERVRDVLLDSTSEPLAKENAYELLDKAYEANGGKLPAAFKLPAGFKGTMQFAVVHGANARSQYWRVFSRGPVKDASTIKNFTVKRLPDQVVLDKATGVGTWEVKHDTPGYEDFNIDSKWLDEPPKDGVFTVRIELVDGTVSEGWFIGRSLTSSATPEVRSPLQQAFKDPHPPVLWTPFYSPEYKPFEWRTLGIYVSGPGDVVAWDFWTGEPGDLGAVRIGDHPGEQKASLAPGDYWMMVGMGEERRFGPVRVIRSSRTDGSFHVVP
jgi:hypothetical protein